MTLHIRTKQQRIHLSNMEYLFKNSAKIFCTRRSSAEVAALRRLVTPRMKYNFKYGVLNNMLNKTEEGLHPLLTHIVLSSELHHIVPISFGGEPVNTTNWALVASNFHKILHIFMHQQESMGVGCTRPMLIPKFKGQLWLGKGLKLWRHLIR